MPLDDNTGEESIAPMERGYVTPCRCTFSSHSGTMWAFKFTCPSGYGYVRSCPKFGAVCCYKAD
uniref:Sodium ion channel toxin n=1 Tax=Edwardsia elegans TaxID=132404 RepID=A0A4Y5RX15_9CNID|nr:sodium ion channel toxin [Edwardsia elegans]